MAAKLKSSLVLMWLEKSRAAEVSKDQGSVKGR